MMSLVSYNELGILNDDLACQLHGFVRHLDLCNLSSIGLLFLCDLFGLTIDNLLEDWVAYK